MLTESLLSAAAEAVFGYLLQESGMAQRVRDVLRIDPERRAFQTALAQAYTVFAGRYPDESASLFDEVFLTGPAAPILAELLTRRGQPDPTALARAWAQHLGHADPDTWPRLPDATQAAADFLTEWETALSRQPTLPPLWDSRSLEQITANLVAIQQTLRDEFRRALEQAQGVSLTITGKVEHSTIIIGDHNTVIQRIVEPVRRLPTDYGTRIANFLTAYLGAPGQPVPFGGRNDALHALDAWLDDAQSPYLLLTAPAGRGKSALLVRWLEALRIARPDLPAAFVPVSIRYSTNLASVTFAALAAQFSFHKNCWPKQSQLRVNSMTSCIASICWLLSLVIFRPNSRNKYWPMQLSPHDKRKVPSQNIPSGRGQ